MFFCEVNKGHLNPCHCVTHLQLNVFPCLPPRGDKKLYSVLLSCWRCWLSRSSAIHQQHRHERANSTRMIDDNSQQTGNKLTGTDKGPGPTTSRHTLTFCLQNPVKSTNSTSRGGGGSTDIIHRRLFIKGAAAETTY